LNLYFKKPGISEKKGLALKILNNNKYKNALALYSLFYSLLRGKTDKSLQAINLKKGQ